jgi:hypothetical protein
MTLRARLTKLEQARPERFAASGLELELRPDICARIAQAQAAGTFPKSLAEADLEAIVAAADKIRGWA